MLLVSSVWGAWLGVATALASAAAFNWFHIPPTGRFTIREGENWVALVVFIIAAVIASTLAQAARSKATEAEHRRREADLSAEMALLLLRGERLDAALPTVSRRLAQSLDLPSAALPAPFVVAISGWYSWVMLPVLKRPSSGRSCTEETASSPAAEST